MTASRRFHVLARDPAAGGSFEEWTGWLGAGAIHFVMSHPPARRIELRFLVPGAPAETRAEGEVLRVDREGETFVVHARLDGLDAESREAVDRFGGGA